jgi:hypothetical protein
MRLALGLKDVVVTWSSQYDCQNFLTLLGEWRIFSSWADYFNIGMTNGMFDEVYWFLDGIDNLQLAIWRGMDRGSAAGITDWELMLFCKQPAWRERCTYFLDGIAVQDPFGSIGDCNG